MKKILIFYIFLLLIINCDNEKSIPGETGIPIYLVPTIESQNDTLRSTFRWSFENVPENSRLDVLSFQPSSNAYNIFFIPDIHGKYKVKCEILNPMDEIIKETNFICEISAATTSKDQDSLINLRVKTEGFGDLPDPIYLDDQKEVDVSKTTKETIVLKTEKPKEITPPNSNKIRKKKTIKGLYTIQISSFQSYQKAEIDLEKLKRLGLEVYIKKVFINEKNETWYRIRSGIYPNYTKAKKEAERLESKLGRTGIWIDKID